MTENEAIERIKYRMHTVEQVAGEGGMEDLEMAIKALEEIQQYHAIGTPEECQKSVAVCKAMIDRKITPEIMEEYMKFEDECVECGFTFKSLLEAREKQTAKKVKSISRVKDGDRYVGLIGRCPCCGDILEEDTVYCDCGQKLDWMANDETD